MKKVKMMLFLFTFILGFVGVSINAHASTPTNGYQWSSSYITYYNDGSNSFYSGIWNTAASRWNATNNVYITKGTKYDFRAGNKNAGKTGWDGITEYWGTSTGYFTKVRAWVNTYYTAQAKYTTSIVNGVATHEMGHSLGLGHNNSTSSVMFPYTFYSDGTLARTTTSPGSEDKATLANLYGYIAIAPQSDVSANPDVKSDNIVRLCPSWAVGYKDIQSLAKDADIVIEGTIESSELKKNAPDDFLSYKTQHTINITDVLKGEHSLKHSSISFYQLGGIDTYANVTYDTGTLLNKGDNVILFLRKDDNGVYSLINENDSIFFANDLSKKEYKYLKNNEKLTKNQIKEKIK
jgi:hypothetical protein